MKNKERTENRKAFPKFLGLMLGAGLVGGLIGVVAGFLSGSAAPEAMVDAIHALLAAASPWCIWIISGVLLGLGFWKYRQAKAQFSAWDGEDEETVEQAEERLNWALGCTSLALVLDFFFAAAGMILVEELLPWIGLLVGFVLSLGGMVALQQKTVDLIKQMNPEKRGSVYDMNFQKKWMASCDENELRQIGQASFKAFNAVNYTCAFSWTVLVLLHRSFNVGILPVFLVTLIWGVSQMAYTLESIRLGRHR